MKYFGFVNTNVYLNIKYTYLFALIALILLVNMKKRDRKREREKARNIYFPQLKQNVSRVDFNSDQLLCNGTKVSDSKLNNTGNE